MALMILITWHPLVKIGQFMDPLNLPQNGTPSANIITPSLHIKLPLHPL